MNAVRRVSDMSAAELSASAMGRVSAVAAKYGADSPQVRDELARWGAMVDTRRAVDDPMALLTALGMARGATTTPIGA